MDNAVTALTAKGHGLKSTILVANAVVEIMVSVRAALMNANTSHLKKPSITKDTDSNPYK